MATVGGWFSAGFGLIFNEFVDIFLRIVYILCIVLECELMKKIIALLALCVAGLACAQTVPSIGKSTPREHRGFYSNMSFGFAYNWYDNSREDIYNEKKNRDLDRYEFGGFSFPMSEFKFGVAIENLVAFHFDINIGFFSGTLDYFNEKYGTICADDGTCAEFRRFEEESESESSDAHGFRTYLGFGTTFYPFRDINSPLNGLFVGGSIGYTLFFTLSNGINEENCGNGGVGFELEIGKDWWVSDHISIGFGLGYSHSSFIWQTNDSHKSDNVVSLVFRMTRG